MIRIVYNFLFFLFFCLSAPYYFLKMLRRGNWRGGFGQRFGRYSEELARSLAGRRTIWIHAVSVGEVNVCTELIRGLQPRLEAFHFVVSTTTSTGMERLRKELPESVTKVYYPIDLSGFVKSALRTIHPSAVILVEAEIWPNFLWRLQRDGIPAFVVNARLSERSYHGYKKNGWLFRSIFSSFAFIGAQNQSDAERFREIGYPDEAVEIPGVLKFDAAGARAKSDFDAGAVLIQSGMKPGAPILVGGSTHDGEEAILSGIAERLRARFPDLFLVIVPRHMERRRQIARALRDAGVKFLLRSELEADSDNIAEGNGCLVVDSTGELVEFYRAATIVFVGKSLTSKGGQNPIEPCSLGKATIFGPKMQNFPYVAEAFVTGGGAIQVDDASGLEGVIAELLGDAARREELGANALKVVKANQGAVARTVEMVMARLDAAGVLCTGASKSGQ